MHQYKTITQTLLVLSILNLVFAAPVVRREARDTGNDVVVVANDVTTVSERRGDATDGTTPLENSSPLSDAPSPHGSLPLGEPALLQGSASSSEPAPLSHVSAMDGQMVRVDSTSAHPLSTAEGPAPTPVPITEASTSSDPLSSTAGPAPVPDSTAEGSTTPHYTAVTYDMLDRDPPIPPSEKMLMMKKVIKRVAAVTFAGGVAATSLYLIISGWHSLKKDV
jgi:hypothetical protein